MIVEISFCFRDSKPAGQHCCCKILCARLAIASSDRDHAQSERSPVIRREFLVRFQSIFCADEREILPDFPAPIGVDDCSGCTSVCDRLNEIVPIVMTLFTRTEVSPEKPEAPANFAT